LHQADFQRSKSFNNELNVLKWKKWICSNNSGFISVIHSLSNLIPIKMNPKKLLSKEISAKVRGQISEKTVNEKVDQFFKHGNTFLLLELVSLRREVECLREELQYQRNSKRNSLRALIVP
jgi:hypothetical protein